MEDNVRLRRETDPRVRRKADLRKLGENALSQLRQSLRADTLVCYFHNSLAKYYWLFYADGSFRYPEQMHGGIAYDDQLKRITFDADPQNDPDIKFFRDIPSELSSKIFWGEPFVTREGVKHCLRIHIRFKSSRGKKTSAGSVIFLNYRKRYFPKEPWGRR